jgi:hypothetical protein
MSRSARTIAVLLFLALHAAALACIHPPAGFPGRLTEREKAAFLFHDGENAHLVIRTSVATDGAALPERMAWVIPFPALPSKYEEVDGELFSELARLIPRVRQRPAPVATAKAAPAKMAKAEAPSIRVHAAETVGSYQVQPIEILSESAGSELNAWLVKNRFDPVSPHNQQYYLKKGAVFLTLRVEGLKGQESGVKPLHIVYRDDRMRLPLKFSGHSGVFDVRLYALTEQPPARKALEAYGLEVRDASYRMDDRFAERAPLAAKLVGARAGYLTEFIGLDYNLNRPVVAMEEDPWLMRTGAGRGGEPGGADNAAIQPAYPLVAVREASRRGPIQADDENALTAILMAAWLVAAILCLVVVARRIVGIVRTPAWDRGRRLGNHGMLAGLALLLLAVPVMYFNHYFGLWGYVPEHAAAALSYAALGLFAGGLVLRLATIGIGKPAN